MDGGWSFRRVVENDFDLLGRWLAQPHVSRWWNHDWSPAAVQRDFGPSARGEEPNEDWLAMMDERAVGLLQRCWWRDYPDYRAELEPVYPVPADAISVDYLIGDPADTGRGLGQAMLAAFLRHTWQQLPAAGCVVIPVVAANRASWRALQKVGFTVVADGDLEPDNPIDDPAHRVLRLDRPDQ